MAAWPEELGTCWASLFPALLMGSSRYCFTHLTRCLHTTPDESCTCQKSSPGGCRRDKEQVVARSCPGQMSRAGQAGVGLQPMALHGPQADVTMLPLSITPGLLPYPTPKTPPPSSAPGSLQPCAQSRNWEEEPRREGEDSLHLQK